MKIRMMPIAQLFNRYPRLVRELSRETGKLVQLEIRGEDTELDKMIIEEISDPLIHIIRNAVDHGIESRQERLQNGKSAEGRLVLEAFHESNHVVIEIRDDGRGIEPERIRSTALTKQIYQPEELERMSAKDILEMIMKPGFSTAERVTHTSGRGMGMDVVRKNIEKLNGSVEVESKPGAGTCIRIKIPLTLAIIPALLVRVGPEIYTVPLAAVEETLRIEEQETSYLEGIEVIHLRQSTLPLIRLTEVFGLMSMGKDPNRAFVVVVNTGVRQVGLVVDELLGQEEVVIKPLVDYLQDKSGFSGATILGDGEISLILDVSDLVQLSVMKKARREEDPQAFVAAFDAVIQQPVGDEATV
jgi:two-component system chemotaxis sensor kinase CheA